MNENYNLEIVINIKEIKEESMLVWGGCKGESQSKGIPDDSS